MEPTYAGGDRLLVAYGVRPRIGRAHVIRLPDGPDGPRPIAVKRITRAVGDGWWVERDNPAEGVDSWLVGEIPTADVLGLVLLRVRRAKRS
ncbi:hypothetical protein [Flexivirga sp.]|uniref:hypothetical protein n=1 Tax=Flexivirga sp. TaxID=1962927 RepID=UPI003F7F9AD6